jgi:integrase
MPNATLSAEFVRKAVCEDGKAKTDWYDTSIIGFLLETRKTGGKTYALRYRDAHNRQRQHKIGDVQSLSFDKARQAAQVLRSRVVLGESLEGRKVKRAIPTLAEFVAARYIVFIKGYKKSWTSDLSYLKNHLLPKWGACHLDEISQHSVIEFHHGMRAEGYAAATANRMIILLSFIYSQAKRWKIPGTETNPCIGVKLFQTVSRERFLTPAETQHLMLALEQSESAQLKSIVSLLLLLGCRRQELLGSRWVEFDLERRNWRIPMS